MAAYVVVEIEVEDPIEYERYKGMAPPSITHYGGRYLVRGAQCETLEGDWTPRRLVILEFPDLERARSWWSSEEYREARALRHRTARTRMVLIEGIAKQP